MKKTHQQRVFYLGKKIAIAYGELKYENIHQDLSVYTCDAGYIAFSLSDENLGDIEVSLNHGTLGLETRSAIITEKEIDNVLDRIEEIINEVIPKFGELRKKELIKKLEKELASTKEKIANLK